MNVFPLHRREIMHISCHFFLQMRV